MGGVCVSVGWVRLFAALFWRVGARRVGVRGGGVFVLVREDLRGSRSSGNSIIWIEQGRECLHTFVRASSLKFYMTTCVESSEESSCSSSGGVSLIHLPLPVHNTYSDFRVLETWPKLQLEAFMGVEPPKKFF